MEDNPYKSPEEENDEEELYIIEIQWDYILAVSLGCCLFAIFLATIVFGLWVPSR